MLEGDVLLFNTQDGGNINMVNGQPEMTAGFESAIFLSLFGGNFEDDGLAGNKKTWWGNLNENDPAFKYISRLQNLYFQGVPLTAANLRRFEQAVLADLEWFKEKKIAGEVLVVGSIPRLNRLGLEIDVSSPQGENSHVEYLINWQSYL
jgi:phage gp46-like protein